jgi:hypothetical protein
MAALKRSSPARCSTARRRRRATTRPRAPRQRLRQAGSGRRWQQCGQRRPAATAAGPGGQLRAQSRHPSLHGQDRGASAAVATGSPGAARPGRLCPPRPGPPSFPRCRRRGVPTAGRQAACGGTGPPQCGLHRMCGRSRAGPTRGRAPKGCGSSRPGPRPGAAGPPEPAATPPPHPPWCGRGPPPARRRRSFPGSWRHGG